MKQQNLLQIPMYPEYGYDDANELDMDVEYAKELYPRSVRAIQLQVDEECDKLEYDGSCMFDEIPSCEHLGSIVDMIYERVSGGDKKELQVIAEQTGCVTPPPWDWSFCPPPFTNRPVRLPRPDYHADGSPDWLKGLILVLLTNEMLQRRRRHRRRKRPYQSI